MGRAGGGGGGGHSGGGHSPGGGHSGGGHSPGGGHSGGGHSPGGGFSGGGFSGGGRPGGPGGPGGPPPPRHGFWGGYGYGGYRRGCGTGCLTPIIIVIVFIIIIGSSVISGIGGGVRYALSRLRGNTQQITDDADYEGYDWYDEDEDSTENTLSGSSREKADTGVTFTSDCILDELGWVEDAASVGESLEDFYNATGVQPFVYFKAYDASLTTDSEKEEYAFDWYDENIDNEGTFLFIYFAEEDTDNDIGYMVYVNGYDIDSVMDEEAIEIFWDYVDEYWYSSLSTDDMLTEIFNSTADAIMN